MSYQRCVVHGSYHGDVCPKCAPDDPGRGNESPVTSLEDALFEDCDRMRQKIHVMGEALKRADRFITNGVALGYIQMPDESTPDPAKDTPRIIRDALAYVPPEALATGDSFPVSDSQEWRCRGCGAVVDPTGKHQCPTIQDTPRARRHRHQT